MRTIGGILDLYFITGDKLGRPEEVIKQYHNVNMLKYY